MVTRRNVLRLGTLTATGGFLGCLDRHGSVLDFDRSVDSTSRRRCRRAAERTLNIVEESPDESVGVRFIDPADGIRPADRTNQFARLVDRALHIRDVELPTGFVSLGKYNSKNRTINLVDPGAVRPREVLQQFVDGPTETVLDESAIDVDDPETWYPIETLLAHELTHAIQHDMVNWLTPADSSYDGTRALRAIVEGTADFVEGRYRAKCRDDMYNECSRVPIQSKQVHDTRMALKAGRQPYVNGRHFVTRLAEWGGWDNIFCKATVENDLFPNPIGLEFTLNEEIPSL